MNLTDTLAWIDVETTGLDAQDDDLLQVACILTDAQLNELDAEPFEAVVHSTPSDVARMRARASDVVRDMHDRTGLWARLSSPTSMTLRELDAALLAYIARFAPEPRQARVAGNSVRLDLNFLDAKLPATAAHLHYRFVDVSGIAFIAEHNLNFVDRKAAPEHEALADIRGSIQQLRRVLSAITPVPA